MTADYWMTFLVAGLVAFYLAKGLLAVRLTAPPRKLMKTNVRGLEVPAVMGGPLVLASLIVLGGLAIAGALGWGPSRPNNVMSALAAVTAIMAIAGAWDDRRGDERPRGFAGHLGAAKSRQLTGGIVKILAALVAGAIAAAFLVDTSLVDRPSSVVLVLIAVAEITLLVGATANFVNLTDRAPGRAAKVSLILGVPLLVFGSRPWGVAALPLLAALMGCLLADLRERAMLGDAGANPLGAVIGLGLALSLPHLLDWLAIALLLALNLISEKWSFSRAIERTPPLKWLDGLGRMGQSRPD